MPDLEERMFNLYTEFKKTNRGVQPQRFVLSEEDMLTFTVGDSATETKLTRYGIPVVVGDTTHIE